MRKYVELIVKTLEAKIMMQSRFSDDCERVYNIEILNLFDPQLQLINTKSSAIKNKLKDLLHELKKCKVQIISASEYKKIDDHETTRKFFQVRAQLIVNDSDIDKEFR